MKKPKFAPGTFLTVTAWITIGVIMGAGVGFSGAWVTPSGAPPDGNIGAPISTGTTTQVKLGGLGIGGLLQIGDEAGTAGALRIPKGAGSGKVLVSDDQGYASWGDSGKLGQVTVRRGVWHFHADSANSEYGTYPSVPFGYVFEKESGEGQIFYGDKIDVNNDVRLDESDGYYPGCIGSGNDCKVGKAEASCADGERIIGAYGKVLSSESDGDLKDENIVVANQGFGMVADPGGEYFYSDVPEYATCMYQAGGIRKSDYVLYKTDVRFSCEAICVKVED